jgi:hypothetical protein
MTASLSETEALPRQRLLLPLEGDPEVEYTFSFAG